MNARRLAIGFASTALLVAVVTLLSRVAGFGRWLVFSPTVGAGGVGTAYQSANQLPNVLFEVIAGGALAAVVVPLLAAPLARARGAEVAAIASALLTWALTLTVPLALVLAVFHAPIGAALVSAGSGATQEPGTAALAGRLILMFSPQLVFYAIGAVLTGVLQAHRAFLWPAFMPLLSSIVVMLAYVAYDVTTRGADPSPNAVGAAAEAWLGWGTTAGVLAISLPLLLPTARTGVRLRLTWRFPAGVARRALRLGAAGIAALLAQQAAVVATLLLSNKAGGTGAYVVFSYTQAIYLLPYAVLAVPLATVAFPRLSELATSGDEAGFAEAASRGLRVVAVAGGLGTALLIAAAMPLQAFFSTIDAAGGSSEVPFDAMGAAVVAMSLGLPGWALVAYLSRVFYAKERSRHAAFGTSAGWAAVVIAALVLVPVTVAASPTFLTGSPATAGEATLVALTTANALGMVLAGVVLLLSLRTVAGRGALRGFGRTVAVLAPATLAGAFLGGWVGETILAAAATWGALPAAVTAGVVGAFVAIAVVLAALALGDRSILRAARSLT